MWTDRQNKKETSTRPASQGLFNGLKVMGCVGAWVFHLLALISGNVASPLPASKCLPCLTTGLYCSESCLLQK